ncbi:MAG: MBL fold metallo-hydrolase [Desulfobacteraceae bacterium]|nr:MBL fold metallo-hydrolase [Desulfobacteraceae bacterium]
MQIKTIASSSLGNCYLIGDETTSLLIECGISIKRIKQGLNFGLSRVSGCLVTHEHQDHCRAIRDVMRAGVDCYLTQGTIDALGVTGHRLNPIAHKTKFSIGSWTIIPFTTCHDATEPVGFLISNGIEKLLFATDTAYIKNRFKGLTHIMIECNYQEYILKYNLDADLISKAMKDRLLFSHFSLKNVLAFLKDTDRTALREVHLLHLSAANSNAAEIEQAVSALCAVPVYVAKER